MTVTRDQLAAWVDGELDPVEAARIADAVAADPELTADAAALRALRAQLGAHFAPILDEPVPERLRSLLASGTGAEAVDFTAARQRAAVRAAPRFGWLRYGGAAIAAALVLAVMLRGPGIGGEYAARPLVAALDGQLVATQSADAPVRVLLSFANGQGEICRGFNSAAAAGIACKDGNGWRLERKLPGSAPEAGDYRQAGSGNAALMAAIQDLAQGEPLDAAGEAAAKANGWQR